MEKKGRAVVLALGAFFVMAFVQSMCMALLSELWGPEQAQAGQTLVLGLSAIIVTALLALADKALPQPVLRPVMRVSTDGLTAAVCALLGAAANCTLSAGLSVASFNEQLLAEYTQAVPMGKGAALWLELAAYCLLIPVMEEMLFRGFILDVLRQAFPLAAAAGLECLIFAWGHGQILWFLYALAMGGVLTWLRLKTGSLYAPIAFHIAFNGANYLQPWLYSAAGENRQGLVVLFLAGLLVCLCTAVALMRLRQKGKG